MIQSRSQDFIVNRAAFLRKVRNGNFKIKKIKYPEFKGNEPCTEYHPDIFFVEAQNSNDMANQSYVAKNICKDCPMKMQCLEYALYHEKYGVWGGTTEKQREDLRRQMKIAHVDPYYIQDYIGFQQELNQV